ncbi:MAG: hypothetical protein BroJett025_02910 [Patescibacteria group bacterium]|nr:MAG: hypothetical protein BroJett025_02910 [Patescibacteria group bacterium]
MTKRQSQTKKHNALNESRLFWADAMRALSILMVVIIHSSAKVLYEWSAVETGELSTVSWNFANLLNSFSRISVPLFVMLSGAFLLQKSESLTFFLQKRIPRIVLPWVFWGSIQLLYNYNFSIETILSSTVYEKLATTFFGGFWFMPLILGLYLVTPIIKAFTKTAKTTDYAYFFILWFVTVSLIPTLNQSFGINISLQLPIFVQYLGYFVAGYYLVHKARFSKKSINQFGLLCIVINVVIALGTYCITKFESQFHASLYEYTNVLVAVSSISGFIALRSFFQNKAVRVKKTIQNKIVKISQVSLGIFLSHALILDIFTKGKLGFTLHALNGPIIIALPMTITLVFLTSLSVVLILRKYMNRFIS